jgi:hypothetical protein
MLLTNLQFIIRVVAADDIGYAPVQSVDIQNLHLLLQCEGRWSKVHVVSTAASDWVLWREIIQFML